MRLWTTLTRLTAIGLLSLSLFALQGTAWTDDLGAGSDPTPDVPGGVSWE